MHTPHIRFSKEYNHRMEMTLILPIERSLSAHTFSISVVMEMLYMHVQFLPLGLQS